jgi:uracil-DNA glycosylase
MAVAGSTVTSIVLDGPVDLPGFRHAARDLLAKTIPPDQVSWHSSSTPTQDLFADLASSAAQDEAGKSGTPGKPGELGEQPAAPAATTGEGNAPPINVPPEFLTLCQAVILHSDPNRFGLLYRLLWRLVHEPALRHDPLDADWVQAQHMAQAVRRDMHKMKAFVRFRAVEDMHIAWFEPDHHTVEATAPFFVRRFTQMRWAILTPECSIEWHPADGNGKGSLHTGPGAHKADAPPAYAGEALWLTYYQNIFNPARLKLKMMQKEMPKRYWKNLPEAQFISELTAASSQRRMGMIEQAPTEPRRRIPVFTEGAAATARGQAALNVNQTLAQMQQGENPLNLQALNAAAQACRACPIGQHATQAVCGEGPLRARVMVVGEQPGDQEDLRGRPLVGPSGQLFDRALDDLGWGRASLFITNAVKHFKYEPRGKRRMHKTPSQLEAAACLHWLESEIDLVKPEAVIALGATAASSLLGRKVAVMSERGQWFSRSDGLRVLVTLHPAALLRAPQEQQAAAYAAWLSDLALASRLALG